MEAAATAAETRRLLPSLSYVALACIFEEWRIAAAAERSVLSECVPDLSHVIKEERRSYAIRDRVGDVLHVRGRTGFSESV